jgi:superfamily II DNA or RNA helicase
LLIADEMHNLGATKIKECLNDRVQYRLGLSATPERHFDETGTKIINDYFGGVVFEFSLADAIKAKVLSPYDYFPVLVDLTEHEAEEYWKITDEISRQALIDDDEPNPFLDILLIKRARLLASAKNKLVALRIAFASLAGPPKQTIVYCGDGRVDFKIDNELERHVTAVTKLLGEDMGLRVRRFTADESSDERERILRDLREEDLDAIVAIRCLDEGIDIPSVRMGFILASSTNPRQYIQRRGRLLRPAEGKDKAIIYDFIVNPPDYGGVLDDRAFNIERRLFRRELKRVIEFCATARNGMTALNTLTLLRKKYNLLGEIN